MPTDKHTSRVIKSMSAHYRFRLEFVIWNKIPNLFCQKSWETNRSFPPVNNNHLSCNYAKWHTKQCNRFLFELKPLLLISEQVCAQMVYNSVAIHFSFLSFSVGYPKKTLFTPENRYNAPIKLIIQIKGGRFIKHRLYELRF